MVNKKKILVVDDEDDMLVLLEKRLTWACYEVIKASGGYEAVQKAKIWKPDLILLDIMLPDIDGGEVLELLKEDPDTKNIPVVFLTALFTKDDKKEKGNMLGGNVYLSKTFETEELLNVVKNNIR